MARCAVTGANGFLGAHLVRELLRRGHAVIALVGPDQDAHSLDGLKAELRSFDLREPASLRSALGGAESVIHSAARYDFWAADSREIYRINVEGTRHVLEAARALGVKKFVHTSSAATLSPGFADDRAASGDEQAVFDASRFRGHYKMSKLMAEMLVLRAAASGLPAVIVHPTTVLGPGDRRPTPSGSMIEHYINGRMKVFVEMAQNLVDVRDAAAGHVLALEQAPAGARYVLGGDNVSMRELLAILAELTGIAAPRLALPQPLLYAMGAANEWLAKFVTGHPPIATREAALHARDSRYLSSDKARRELGYTARPARAVLAGAVRWFAGEGRCDAQVAQRILQRPQLAAALHDAT